MYHNLLEFIFIEYGQEYGTTTGRKRKVNWLNRDKLIQAINISGTTTIIVSKVDVLEKVGTFKLIHNTRLQWFDCIQSMKDYIHKTLHFSCPLLEAITFSSSTELL